ncbi:RNA ligase/cyclic nucleotide phosphodiesterase [Pelagophyceae sp. CCMP2097]|nr:RNA ligase/cyclic nucleotide phosphodiesterase [Pelagophyceae sp. CCMP2097]
MDFRRRVLPCAAGPRRALSAASAVPPTAAAVPPLAAAPKRRRPTHFFAVRVAGAGIREAVVAAQEALVSSDPALLKCLVDANKIHVTLAVLTLDDAAQVDRAVSAGRAAAVQTAPFVADLPRLETFGSGVLFARVVEEETQRGALEALAGRVRAELHIQGFDESQADFKPHATVAKTSTWRRGRSAAKQPKLRAPEASGGLGRVVFDELELLRMAGGGEYYPVVATFKFGAA